MAPTVAAMLNSWNWTWAVNALDWQNIEGWRVAFAIVGIPGIVVALLVKLTIKEPPRGYTDPVEMQNKEQVGFREVLRILSKKPAYWHVTMGVTIASFVNYGVGQFFVSFLIRTHELSIFDASVKVALALAIMASIGTYMSGYLADKYAERFPKALALIPMFALLGVIPMHVVGYLAESLWLAVPLMMVGQMLLYTYLCPLYAVPSGVVDSRMRATAVAVTLFIVNLLGYGLGPPLIGGLSTILNATFLSGLDPALTLEACKASDLAVAAAGRLRFGQCGRTAMVDDPVQMPLSMGRVPLLHGQPDHPARHGTIISGSDDRDNPRAAAKSPSSGPGKYLTPPTAAFRLQRPQLSPCRLAVIRWSCRQNAHARCGHRPPSHGWCRQYARVDHRWCKAGVAPCRYSRHYGWPPVAR